MATLEELKKIGWPKLNKDQRDEFKKLSEGENKKVDEKMETVTISKSALQELIAEALKKERENKSDPNRGVSDWMVYKGEKKRKHTATLRRYRENSESPTGLVIDWWLFEYARDEVTGRKNVPIYNFKLRYDDGATKVIKMPLEEYSKINTYEKVKILEMKKETLVQKQGETRRKVIIGDGYLTDIPVLGESNLIDLNVFRDVYVCTVELEDKSTLEISADRLNS